MGDQPDIGRRLAGCLQVISNRLFFVDADVSGVSANITLVEDAARKHIELFLFERAKQARANLRSGGNFVERDATQSRAPAAGVRRTLLRECRFLQMICSLGLSQILCRII